MTSSWTTTALWLESKNSAFHIQPGEAEEPEVRVETDHMTLAGLVYGDLILGQALESEKVRLEGDKGAFEQFLRLFPLPKTEQVG